MTQAVWRSPLLTKAKQTLPVSSEVLIEGSGEKFKVDFLKYLRAYDTRRTICKDLIVELEHYNFSDIRGSLIASVPGRHSVDDASWGWPALKRVLRTVPSSSKSSPDIVLQVSSIATLGGTDAWLAKTVFPALAASKTSPGKPRYSLIFPTADEIRRSLDGYESGASIHTKVQSSQQAKQLQYLKPIFHHWAGDGSHHASSSDNILDAGRKRAAPHIKTYVRFSDSAKTNIDWALVTSANLSKQAWGEAYNTAGEVRIASWELGVIIWPELYGQGSKMAPSFKMDKPVAAAEDSEVTIGFRMPYDLPLVPYGEDDIPWVATMSHTQPDWKGETWAI